MRIGPWVEESDDKRYTVGAATRGCNVATKRAKSKARPKTAGARQFRQWTKRNNAPTARTFALWAKDVGHQLTLLRADIQALRKDYGEGLSSLHLTAPRAAQIEKLVEHVGTLAGHFGRLLREKETLQRRGRKPADVGVPHSPDVPVPGDVRPPTAADKPTR